MAKFKEIDEARRLLGLGEKATLQEIREAYRKLALKYHPDKCKQRDKKEREEMFKKINHANEILLLYCAGYEISFKEENVKKTAMDNVFHDHLKRFYDGWWGDLDL